MGFFFSCIFHKGNECHHFQKNSTMCYKVKDDCTKTKSKITLMTGHNFITYILCSISFILYWIILIILNVLEIAIVKISVILISVMLIEVAVSNFSWHLSSPFSRSLFTQETLSQILHSSEQFIRIFTNLHLGVKQQYLMGSVLFARNRRYSWWNKTNVGVLK